MTPLKPRNLRDLLDDSFDLYRAMFVRQLALSLPLCLAIYLIGTQLVFPILQPVSLTDPDAAINQTGQLILLWIGLGFLAYWAGLGAFAPQLCRAVTGGKLATPLKWRPMAFLATFTGVLFVIVFWESVTASLWAILGIAIAPLLFMVRGLDYLYYFFGFILFALIPSVYQFVLPSFVIEGKTPSGAFDRGLTLFFYQPLKNGFTLTAIPLLSVLSLILIGMIAANGPSKGNAASDTPLTWSDAGITAFSIGLLQALAMPVFLNLVFLLYYDLRVRREGYDLELLAEGMTSANDAIALEDGLDQTIPYDSNGVL